MKTVSSIMTVTAMVCMLYSGGVATGTPAADGLIWSARTSEDLSGKTLETIRTGPGGSVYVMATEGPDALWSYDAATEEWSEITAWRDLIDDTGRWDENGAGSRVMDVCSNGYIHAGPQSEWRQHGVVLDPATGAFAHAEQGTGYGARNTMWVDDAGRQHIPRSNAYYSIFHTDGIAITEHENFLPRDRVHEDADGHVGDYFGGAYDSAHGVGDVVWVRGTSDRVLRSTDGGQTWWGYRDRNLWGNVVFALDEENAILGCDDRVNHFQWFEDPELGSWGAYPTTRIGDLSGDILGLYAESLDSIWAVGADGLASYWDGSEWTDLGLEATGTLWSIAKGDDGYMWVSGEEGQIFMAIPEPSTLVLLGLGGLLLLKRRRL